MNGILATISNLGKIAGSILEAALLSNPNTTEAEAQTLVEKNADLLVTHALGNTFLAGIADGLVNEIIAVEVPQLYAQQLKKLGGLPAAQVEANPLLAG